MCGQTEIIASDIRKVIEDLSEQHDPCSAATGFEHQFQVKPNEGNISTTIILCIVIIIMYHFIYIDQILRQLHYVSEEDCYSNATTEHNIAKNRYSNKLPSTYYEYNNSYL